MDINDFRSGVRPAPISTNRQLNPVLSTIRMGKVVRVGLVENMECSAFVFVYKTNEVVKVNASLNSSASQGGVGQWNPYHVGDIVFIAYLFGEAGKPTIVGRSSPTFGLSEEILSDIPNDVRIPQPNTVSPSGQPINPNPSMAVPMLTKYAGFASVQTSGIIL